uniref:Uncharacterized protein n=1 Tax=Rhizophora mucronata TaxID=61149 RepID=A0A2P2P2M5_RHIMU
MVKEIRERIQGFALRLSSITTQIFDKVQCHLA